MNYQPDVLHIVLVLLLLTLNIFRTFSSVSIVYFELVPSLDLLVQSQQQKH